MFGRCTITPVAPDYVDKLAERMKQLEGTVSKRSRPKRSRSTGRSGKGFRRHEIPPSTPRGFFTVILEDEDVSHWAQVWATTATSAASVMAPWARHRLRRARRDSDVPVEVLGWDEPGPSELSEKSGIPEDELDHGLTYGTELCNVWVAKQQHEGREQSLYVIETLPMGAGVEGDGY